MERIFNRLYYDPRKTTYLSSINKLYKASKLLNKNVTLKDVKNFMSNQRVSTIHKPSLHKFKRSKCTGSGLWSDLHCDLADFGAKLKRHNNGNRL